jgi:hypothetical protein
MEVQLHAFLMLQIEKTARPVKKHIVTTEWETRGNRLDSGD